MLKTLRRIATLALLAVFLIVGTSAPAIAQTGDAEVVVVDESPASSALAVVALLGVLGLIVKSLIDAVKRQPWASGLHGTGIQALAVVLGFVLCYFRDVRATEALLEAAGAAGGPGGRAIPAVVDYIIGGFAVAALAGFFHEQKKPEAVVVEVDASGAPV